MTKNRELLRAYRAKTPEDVRDAIINDLDFLEEAELLLIKNVTLLRESSYIDESRKRRRSCEVGWAQYSSAAPFLLTREHPNIDHYKSWVLNGQYSAVLFDMSILQMTYRYLDSELTGYRLCYVPAPYDFNAEDIELGTFEEVLELYRGEKSSMRTPLRFDFDPGSAREGHSASHFTFNHQECRVPCVGALHPSRFLDFVFTNFYPDYRANHHIFFESRRNAVLATDRLSDFSEDVLHINWRVQPSVA